MPPEKARRKHRRLPTREITWEKRQDVVNQWFALRNKGVCGSVLLRVLPWRVIQPDPSVCLIFIQRPHFKWCGTTQLRRYGNYMASLDPCLLIPSLVQAPTIDHYLRASCITREEALLPERPGRLADILAGGADGFRHSRHLWPPTASAPLDIFAARCHLATVYATEARKSSHFNHTYQQIRHGYHYRIASLVASRSIPLTNYDIDPIEALFTTDADNQFTFEAVLFLMLAPRSTPLPWEAL